VTKLSFTIELDLLDPGVQSFWPFILPNPWSYVYPFSAPFKMYSKYADNNLTYVCTITYQNLL